MKKITFLILLLFIKLIAIAQPVLNATDINPLNNDNNYHATFNSNLSTGNPGANQIWDFSNLQLSTSGSYINASSVLTAPFANSFPDANYYVKSGQTVDEYYGYYKLSNDKLESLGDSNNTSILSTYTNPETVFVFPFSYNDSFTDTYQTSNSATVETKIVAYDGYGTLITQIGTFNDVIRFKTVVNVNGGIAYNWFKLNPFQDLLSAYQNSNGTFNFFVYERRLLSTNKYATNNKFSISPNPTTGILTINNDFSNIDNFINVYDIFGNQIIKNKKIDSTTATINLSDNSTGLYLIKITDSNNTVLHSDKVIKN